MGFFDRFKAPSEEDERDLPVCDECGEACCVGIHEAIRVEEDDLWFCSFTCLVKYDEVFTVQQLGGKFV